MTAKAVLRGQYVRMAQKKRITQRYPSIRRESTRPEHLSFLRQISSYFCCLSCFLLPALHEFLDASKFVLFLLFEACSMLPVFPWFLPIPYRNYNVNIIPQIQNYTIPLTESSIVEHFPYNYKTYLDDALLCFQDIELKNSRCKDKSPIF